MDLFELGLVNIFRDFVHIGKIEYVRLTERNQRIPQLDGVGFSELLFVFLSKGIGPVTGQKQCQENRKEGSHGIFMKADERVFRKFKQFYWIYNVPGTAIE